MHLIPTVKNCTLTPGTFSISASSVIYAPFYTAKANSILTYLKFNLKKSSGFDLSFRTGKAPLTNVISLEFVEQDSSSEAYRIVVNETNVCIYGESLCGLFRGVTTFIQMIRRDGFTIRCCEISDAPDFALRGVLHDVTRGKVPLLDDLKEIVEKCAFYKINHFQLYIEHTYAFSMVPEFKTDFDALCAEEILELDEFCKCRYVDLVPALATFGHLYELLRIKRFSHLNELDIDASVEPRNLWDRMAHYTLYPGCEESYLLVKSMIEELAPLFSSRYFNICADETFDLGKGKSAAAVSKVGTGQVYAEFVNKVLAVVIKMGKVPMMWGDIICNHPEILSEFPKETIFLNWGYGADITSESTERFGNAGVNYLVCPGVMGWSRFANNINDASQNIRKMVQFGNQYGASGVLNTNWGDCGHVNFTSNSIHGIALGASLSWNKNSFENDVDFDRVLSSMEWGRGCEKVAELLRELGSLTWYHVGNLYAWVNKKECLWYKELDIQKLSADQLHDAFVRSCELKDELSGLLSIADQEQKHSLEEIVWSASAISWTLAIVQFKRDSQSLLFGKYGKKEWLVAQGCSLLEHFIILWRKRNKESELRNVVEIFNGVITEIQSFHDKT